MLGARELDISVVERGNVNDGDARDLYVSGSVRRRRCGVAGKNSSNFPLDPEAAVVLPGGGGVRPPAPHAAR